MRRCECRRVRGREGQILTRVRMPAMAGHRERAAGGGVGEWGAVFGGFGIDSGGRKSA